MPSRSPHALLCLACTAVAAVAFAGGPAGKQAVHSTDTSRVDDAAGAAVVASLKSQFDGREVEFEMSSLDTDRVSRRDIALDGAGRIRIDGSDGWLPVRFQALYDTATGTVLSPELSLDRNPSVPADTPTVGLDTAVSAALDEEFASQEVAFELDSAWRTGGSERFAVVDGEGVARFEGEGSADVRLQAVYDLVDERWIHVGYALGGEPAPPAPAFAGR